jgi:benzoate 4-monooxygenase
MHFKPERWLNDSSASKSRFLIPFSIGHRMCIGRNFAVTNILKTVITLVTMFDIEPVEARKEVRVRSSGIGKMEGTFLCRVKGRGGAGLS